MFQSIYLKAATEDQTVSLQRFCSSFLLFIYPKKTVALTIYKCPNRGIKKNKEKKKALHLRVTLYDVSF